jgi:hypothetical protein
LIEVFHRANEARIVWKAAFQSAPPTCGASKTTSTAFGAIFFVATNHFLLFEMPDNSGRVGTRKTPGVRSGRWSLGANAANSAASPMIKMNLWLREFN